MAIFTINWRGAAASQVGTRIDGYGQHQPIPSLTAITGLLGAALGYRVGDPRLNELADSIHYAVIVHDAGTPYIDYQTADLTCMPEEMWWNDGERVGTIRRAGSGPARQRRTQQRPLAAGVNMTVVIQTDHLAAEEIHAALDRPRYPLCLGRENCPPSGRVAGEVMETDDLTIAARSFTGVLYLPLDQVGWGDRIVSIPSRGRSASLFAVSTC